MHACILGAGVVGIATALQLISEGHEVTLVDAQTLPGQMCSAQNGAQLSYAYVAPLADASVWSNWPHYLFSPHSPLTLAPQADPAQWSWLIRFLASCRTSRARDTTRALLNLSQLSRTVLHQHLQERPYAIHHRCAGKLVMLSSAQACSAAQRQIDMQAEQGCRQSLLDMTECVAIEPALAHAQARWHGGVHTASEEVADCQAFCLQTLAQLTMHRRFRFLGGQRIERLHVDRGRLHAISHGGTRTSADAFVLALGAHSAGLAARVGVRLDIYPLKGYSIDIALTTQGTEAPQVSVTDLSRKIVFARLGQHLRVAGRVELVGHDLRIRDTAVRELKTHTATLFPALRHGLDSEACAPWAGLRPATPSGRPLIGPTAIERLYVNTGHGALGWTLACGSAALLSALMQGTTPPIDPAPFLCPA